ncbi:MAG TPA: hypothetical protein VNS19_02455 [Acidimicrobiales bacterium]|nr:hypothetical protein [Acidimicrobiales bacterium]
MRRLLLVLVALVAVGSMHGGVASAHACAGATTADASHVRHADPVAGTAAAGARHAHHQEEHDPTAAHGASPACAAIVLAATGGPLVVEPAAAPVAHALAQVPPSTTSPPDPPVPRPAPHP